MKFVFKHKKISGILCVLPQEESLFVDEAEQYTFPVKQTLRLQKVMGFDRHRIVKPETSSFDFAAYGLERLLAEKKLKKEEVAALIVVTITPDHFVPHVSNQLQGHFGFGEDVICMDIMQGCNGFLLGLMQAFLLLEHNRDKKVVLVNVDVLSKKVSRQDRNSFPIIGDCAAITIVEHDENAKDLFLNIHTHGADGQALLIPAGGSRLPCSAETAKMKDAGDGNIRCLDNLVMDGTAVFQYVMNQVPPLIKETFAFSKWDQESIDWYLFHQPNRFMLQKLADKIGAPREKMFMNIVEHFGNPSGASIPLVMAYNLGESFCQRKFRCCLSAFGGGLSCGALVGEFGEMNFCETVISDC